MRRQLIAGLTLMLAVPNLAHAQTAPAEPAVPPPFTNKPPAYAAPVADDGETEWNSPALFGSGVLVATLGTASLIGGALMFASIEEPEPCSAEDGQSSSSLVSASASCDLGAGISDSFNNGMKEGFGTLLVVHGAAALATAIPLMVAGAWPVPIDSGAAAMPVIRLGAGYAELTWSF